MAAAPTALQPYERKMYLAQSLDPIHVGTGEFQLGRVDNTIVREPGTNLPKIPGSSIAGVARAYTAMMHKRYRTDEGVNSCAGKGGADGESHCGKCVVCTAFGFSKGRSKKSFQGLAQFGDARLLFFPVYSVVGPLWITCPTSLQDAGCSTPGANMDTWLELDAKLTTTDEHGSKSFVYTFGKKWPDPINLGWLYLPHTAEVSPSLPTAWVIPDFSLNPIMKTSYLKPVLDRLVLVSDGRFSNIVEDQLEVRTSVSISPETGAAEDGALFTAEAIPRSAIFFFPVTYLRPENFKLPVEKITINDIQNAVTSGLRLTESLGVGGINTRGMGRLRVLGI